MYLVFAFFDINKTQERAISKQFNQAREKMLLSPNRIVDEEFLANLYEGQLRRSTLMKDALTFYHSDIMLKKEPKRYKRLRAMPAQIFENQRQKSIDLSEGASSRWSSTCVFRQDG